MNTAECNAYAKINLKLDITGRREDGYHTVDMVMQLSLIHISHVDDAVRLAGAVESARHEGVVLRCVAEHDEL